MKESWTDGAGRSAEELKAKLARLEALQKKRDRQDKFVVNFIGVGSGFIILWMGLRDCGVIP